MVGREDTSVAGLRVGEAGLRVEEEGVMGWDLRIPVRVVDLLNDTSIRL